MKPRIVGASVVGLALVAVAFFMSANGPTATATPDPALAIVAGSAPSRNYIASKDENKDGVPDWQEALRTTQPLQLEAAASSTYKAPDTLTEEFSVQLFERIMRSKGYGPAGATPEEIVNSSISQLSAEAKDKLYKAQDINISSENSAAAIATYGNTIGHIVFRHQTSIEGEIEILYDALRSDEPTRLRDLAPIALAYRTMVIDLQKVSVPSKLIKQHLDLLNVISALSRNVDIFSQAFTDPLHTTVRAQRYENDVLGLQLALRNLIVAIVKEGVYFPSERHTGFLLMAFYPTE